MHRTTTLAALAVAAAAASSSDAGAEIIYGLTTENDVVIFDSSAPSVLLDAGKVTGLTATEDLEAIDFRPATGEVYLLSDSRNVYTFDASTFAASLVGTFSPRIPGSSFAFDFNPAFQGGEFARIITDTNDNRVISGETGQYLLPVEKDDVFYAAGDINENQDPNIAGIGYTNSVAGATSTQQYGIDSDLGVLTTVANNAGTLETVGLLNAGTLTNELGLDISGATGIAYANLQNDINSALYTINLSDGKATFVGEFGAGEVLRDLTVVIPEPTAGLAIAGLLGFAGMRRRR